MNRSRCAISGAASRKAIQRLAAAAFLLAAVGLTGCGQTTEAHVARTICEGAPAASAAGERLDFGGISLVAPSRASFEPIAHTHGSFRMVHAEGTYTIGNSAIGDRSFSDDSESRVPPVCRLEIDGMPVDIFLKSDADSGVLAVAVFRYPERGVLQPMIGMLLEPADDVRLDAFRRRIWSVRRGDPRLHVARPGAERHARQNRREYDPAL